MHAKTHYDVNWHPVFHRKNTADTVSHLEQGAKISELHRFCAMQDSMNGMGGASSFFFMLDLSRRKFIYVSKAVKNLTGYHAEEVINEQFSFCYHAWHPKDVKILSQLHQKLFAFFYSTPLHDRTRLKFSYNFRFKRKDSTYMHYIQQTVFMKLGERGTPLVDFSTFTDITPFKKDNHLTLVIHKINGAGEYEEVYREGFCNYDFAFTRRQLEIMSLISKGMTTKEIAASLFLSADTVKNHRKNILKMTGSKNVVEVYKAMVNGFG